MVYKIINNKFRIFVESLLVVLVIFMVGFSIGFYVEFSRTNKIATNYLEHEIEALDLKLQNYYYQTLNSAECDAAIEQNFIFADKIYSDGLLLEKYEEANQITDDLAREKRRYVLLKTELWLNSIVLKEKCNDPFDTIVYFYSGDPSDNLALSKQKVISNVLKEVKENRGNSVVLIPIAGDLGLGAVDVQLRAHDISDLPAILINEDKILYGYHDVEEIESYLR